MDVKNITPAAAASDAQAIIDAVERLDKSESLGFILNDAGAKQVTGTVVVLPEGKTLHSLKPFFDEVRLVPERLKGTARLTTLESFIEHVLRFKDNGTAIFCADYNSPNPKLIAVFDYSYAETVIGIEEGSTAKTEIRPRFGQHRAQYDFPLSDEWRAWKGMADKGAISQAQFAEFLEERIADVLPPEEAGEQTRRFAEQLGMTMASPQRLLGLSRGLSVRVSSKVTNVQNLSSGEGEFQYSEEHQNEAGAPLKVPGAFVLSLPVFRNGAPYQVPVRLRYQVSGGQVTWRFVLQRIDRVWDHAMNEACKLAATETGRPLYYGSPEA
jgi:uncharacterized protein YfdQ (DUF2303 family)